MDKIIVFAIPFFFGLIGLELLFNFLKKKNFYEFKDSITCLGTGVLNQMNGLIAVPLTAFVYHWTFNFWNLDQAIGANYFTSDISTSAGVATWIFGFIITDFLSYWSHRHSHEMNFMWATHIVHHSSEEYNLSVALRQPAFGFLVTSHYMLPAALLGIPTEVYFGSSALNLVYQFWVHSRFIKKLGPFEWIMNSPSHHRVHHARQEKYLDKNYGCVFIIWDRIFGTFIKEADEPKYGVYPRYPKHNAVSANIDPWIELFHYMKITKGIKNKLKILFKGPLYIYENFKKDHIVPGVKPDRESKARWFILPLFVFTLAIALVVLNFGNHISKPAAISIFFIVWFLIYLIGRLQSEKLQ